MGVLGTNVATMGWVHWSPVLGIAFNFHLFTRTLNVQFLQAATYTKNPCYDLPSR